MAMQDALLDMKEKVDLMLHWVTLGLGIMGSEGLRDIEVSKSLLL